MRVWSLGQEGLLEEGMATHSSILAWRISWTEEPDGLQSISSQRGRHKLKQLSTHKTPLQSYLEIVISPLKTPQKTGRKSTSQHVLGDLNRYHQKKIIDQSPTNRDTKWNSDDSPRITNLQNILWNKLILSMNMQIDRDFTKWSEKPRNNTNLTSASF